jgi:hypothetical protein
MKKIYRLNISGPGIGDNLVASYSSKKTLRALWRDDVKDFLDGHGITEADDWLPYFTGEKKNAEIRELTASEIFEGVA